MGPAGPGARCTPGAGRRRTRGVAGVVHQARRRVLRVELEDRQEFLRGHPEVHQVGNLRDQAGIGATVRRRHPGAGVPREPGDVQLIDHGLRERALQRRIPLPVIRLRNPPPRSSWRPPCSRRAAQPPGGCSAGAPPQPARRDPGAPCPGRTAGRGWGRTAHSPDSRRAARPWRSGTKTCQ